MSDDYELKRCAACGAWIPVVATMCASCGSSHVDAGSAPPRRAVPVAPRRSGWSATSVLIGANVAVYLWSLYVAKLMFPRVGYGTLIVQGPPLGAPRGGSLADSPLGLVGCYLHESVVDGQWWRLVAATFLHGGVIHIAFNMMALRQLGAIAEDVFGTRRFLVLYALSGVASMAAVSLWNASVLGVAPPPTVGASGAVFGVAGALVAYLGRRGTTRGRAVAQSLAVNLLIMLGLGWFIPLISNTGHVGGLVPGLVFGWLVRSDFATRPDAPSERRWRGLALLAGLVLVVGLGASISNVFLHARPFR